MSLKNRSLNLIRRVFRTDEIMKRVYNDQLKQKELRFFYQKLLREKAALPGIGEAGWRNFSQTDEDGILHYIFSLIGTTNKVCLDIAFGSPYGANTTNLIVNDGWYGILVCAGKESKKAGKFFSTHIDSQFFPPKVYAQWVTGENINSIVQKGINDLNVSDGEIDLFSLDVNGVDYWLWKALEAVKPRVVLVEYLGFVAERSITVPYQPDFSRASANPHFIGASLSAFVKLGREKGYRLVGCNKLGFNAFFVRNGIGDKILPEISARECLKSPSNIEGQKTIWPKVDKLGWVEV